MEVDKELEAGQALDDLVATTVMGWCSPEGYNYWMTLFGDGNFDLHALRATWHPSESIEAAWEVVEKMVTERRMFRLGFNGNGYHFECSLPDGKYPVFDSGTYPTAPLAICAAALLAISAPEQTQQPPQQVAP